ncbi:hypothetical protein Tco_0418740 [Tanacetum coccineum]
MWEAIERLQQGESLIFKMSRQSYGRLVIYLHDGETIESYHHKILTKWRNEYQKQFCQCNDASQCSIYFSSSTRMFNGTQFERMAKNLTYSTCAATAQNTQDPEVPNADSGTDAEPLEQIPFLCDPTDQSDPATRLIPDREEILTLAEESRSKLNKDLVKPFDYIKLNNMLLQECGSKMLCVLLCQSSSDLMRSLNYNAYIFIKSRNVTVLHKSFMNKLNLWEFPLESYSTLARQVTVNPARYALYNEKQENLRVWLLKFLISKKPVPEWPRSSTFKRRLIAADQASVFMAMTSDHNRSELGIQDHSNEQIHKDGDGDALFQLKSDSLPHAHAQTTKTYYKHRDSRIMKAQELKTKTSAQTLIYKIFLQRYQVYQGRLLASFQDDAKYEHVGQDTRSQGGKDDQDGRIKI